MFDRITIKARIDPADTETIVLKNYLEECSEGDEVYYKSTQYANFDGVFIELRGDTLRCRCSICKLWEKSRTGKLDNSRPMTFAMAVRTIGELMLRLCARPEQTDVTYYEIGLTMRLTHEAADYIREVSECAGRVLWNDANYPENRQKTSEKSKYYRKVMKIYDKSFEAAEKGRKGVKDRVLRVETIYKHQKVNLSALTATENLKKIGRIFYQDWSELKFVRELVPAAGVKISQLEKAREIQRIGVTRYKERYRAQWQDGKLTKKQWETMRTFANNWEIERARYTEQIGELEAEFKEKLLKAYQAGIFTPYKRKT